jgi:hypothetical protein
VVKHSDPLRVRRVVYGLLAWVLLGVAWWAVLQRDPRTWLAQLLVPAVAAVVVTAVTLFWVRHNLGIYQRKGPRRGVPAVDEPWTHDSLGRPLAFSPRLAEAPVVRLDLVDGVKRYEVQA